MNFKTIAILLSFGIVASNATYAMEFDPEYEKICRKLEDENRAKARKLADEQRAKDAEYEAICRRVEDENRAKARKLADDKRAKEDAILEEYEKILKATFGAKK